MQPLIYNQHKVDQLLIGELGRFYALRINVVWLIWQGSQELNIDKGLTLFLFHPMSFAHLVIPAGPNVNQCLQRTDITYFNRGHSFFDKSVKLIACNYATIIVLRRYRFWVSERDIRPKSGLSVFLAFVCPVLPAR